jgi:hypothetical protein
MNPNPKNMAHSVRQRLLNHSRSSGDDFQLVLTRFAVERLLYRIGVSEQANDFVLKGAMLFAIWTGAMHRPTRDVDFLGFGETSEQRLAEVFQSFCEITAPDDALRYLSNSVSVEPIREDDAYGGKRVTLDVTLGQARIALQIDVGFGDIVTPAAETVEYPTLLEMAAPRLRAYPKETFVAEKLEAMVKLGLANSRMKDFYDLVVLSRQFAFDGPTLTAAVVATFGRRATTIPPETPVGLSPSFVADDSKRKQWTAFVKRGGFGDRELDLERVVDELSEFLLPVLDAAARGTNWTTNWVGGGPWRSK